MRRAQWWSPSPIQKTCLRSTIFTKRKHVGDADINLEVSRPIRNPESTYSAIKTLVLRSVPRGFHGLTSVSSRIFAMADQRFSEPDFGTRLELSDAFAHQLRVGRHLASPIFAQSEEDARRTRGAPPSPLPEHRADGGEVPRHVHDRPAAADERAADVRTVPPARRPRRRFVAVRPDLRGGRGVAGRQPGRAAAHGVWGVLAAHRARRLHRAGAGHVPPVPSQALRRRRSLRRRTADDDER